MANRARRRQAIEHDPGAHHIEMHVGIFKNRRTVGAVTYRECHACLFQVISGVAEAGKLLTGKSFAVFAFIRYGKMCKQSFRDKSGQTADFRRLGKVVVVFSNCVVQKADPAHARINFQMHAHPYLRGLCRFIKGAAVFL